MRRATILVMVLLVIGGAAILVSGGAADQDRPDVLVISINSLRADHLSCYGYERNTTPNICSLADDGYRYTQAFSQYHWTIPSETSIQTGLYPAVHGIMLDPDGSLGSLPSDIITLAERMDATGYQTHLLAPQGDQAGYIYPDEANVSQGFEQIEAVGRMRSMQGPISLRLREDGPQYIHALPMDLHRPYRLHPEMEPRYLDREGTVIPANRSLADLRYHPEAGYRWPDNRSPVRLDEQGRDRIRDAYDSVLWNIDREIGALMQWLRQQGRYQDTVIIITAPHGERLGEPYPEAGRRVFGHPFPQPETLRVPLIVKPPGDTVSRTIDQPVELIDIYPTIMDILDIEGPRILQGESLVPPYTGSPYVFSGTSVVRNGSWVLYAPGTPGYEGAVLHDRSVPPSGRVDTSAERPAVVEDLMDRIRSWESRNTILRGRIMEGTQDAT